MSRIKRIDPQRPVASLLELTGLSQSELARRMDVPSTSVVAAIKRGDGVTLGWLLRAVASAEQSVDIRISKK